MSISYSYFNDFTGTNGAAIYKISNGNLEISCTTFENNKVTNYGGSIYFTNGQLNITKTTFTKSYSTSCKDNVGGNAVFQDGTDTLFEHISSFLCAIKREESGDSVFLLKNTDNKISFINSTSNSGTGGSGSIALYAKTTASYAKYLNTIDSRDSFAIESWASKYTVTKSNFVHFDKNINLGIVWMYQANLLKFEECCFFETNDVIFSYHQYTCEVISCYSDYQDNQIFIYNPTITTHLLDIHPICILGNILTCNQKKIFIINSPSFLLISFLIS